MKQSALLFIVFLTSIIAGCGRTSAKPVQTDMIDPPTSWLADGKTWTYQSSLNPSDEELLSRFFQVYTEIQGSSDFEGPPKMLAGENSDRRFYWIRGTKEHITWSCVHFEAGEFLTSNGTGDPFSK